MHIPVQLDGNLCVFNNDAANPSPTPKGLRSSGKLIYLYVQYNNTNVVYVVVYIMCLYKVYCIAEMRGSNAIVRPECHALLSFAILR